jgi:hypothetical protein
MITVVEGQDYQFAARSGCIPSPFGPGGSKIYCGETFLTDHTEVLLKQGWRGVEPVVAAHPGLWIVRNAVIHQDRKPWRGFLLR